MLLLLFLLLCLCLRHCLLLVSVVPFEYFTSRTPRHTHVICPNYNYNYNKKQKKKKNSNSSYYYSRPLFTTTNANTNTHREDEQSRAAQSRGGNNKAPAWLLLAHCCCCRCWFCWLRRSAHFMLIYGPNNSFASCFSKGLLCRPTTRRIHRHQHVLRTFHAQHSTARPGTAQESPSRDSVHC